MHGRDDTMMATRKKETETAFFRLLFLPTNEKQTKTIVAHLFRSSLLLLLLHVEHNSMASTDDTNEQKFLTLAEVKTLAADREKCILVIDNRVYDVTRFMDEVSEALGLGGEAKHYSSVY